MKNKGCWWQFPGWPQWPPWGNRLGSGPYVKSNCSSTSWRNAWLDFNQTWQESSSGVGDSKVFIWYMWLQWGLRGRAPKGQNFANFKLLLQIQLTLIRPGGGGGGVESTPPRHFAEIFFRAPRFSDFFSFESCATFDAIFVKIGRTVPKLRNVM